MPTSYAFVDTDNGGTPSNATPDTATSKYHTTSSWPANGARWSTLDAVFEDATIQGLTDDLVIYCQGTAADTTRASSAVTPSWASLTIIGNATQPKWDTTKYRLDYSGASQGALYLQTSLGGGAVTIRNLQCYDHGSNASPVAFTFTHSSSATVTVDSCVFRVGGTGTGTGYACRPIQGGTRNVYVYNCVAYQDASPGGVRHGFFVPTTGTCVAYNCLAYGFDQTAAAGFTNFDTVKNCVSFGNTDDFNGGTMTYCASDDGDGTNAQTGMTAAAATEFVDHANGDFTLLVGSTKCKDNGVSDPGSGLFSDDITGTTRSGSWDIGPYEYVAGGPFTPYVPTFPQRNIRHSGRH